MTQAEYIAYCERHAVTDTHRPGGVEDESELHNQIVAECNRRQWLCFHGSMAHKAMRTLGEPDFTILADRGRVFFVEAKSRNGKLRPEQRALAVAASTLGHTIFVVRSLSEFLEIVK